MIGITGKSHKMRQILTCCADTNAAYAGQTAMSEIAGAFRSPIAGVFQFFEL